MATRGGFLGLQHDLSEACQASAVRFWVRERLEIKVKDIMRHACRTNRLSPATAAKLYGIVSFMENGIHGKLETLVSSVE